MRVTLATTLAILMLALASRPMYGQLRPGEVLYLDAIDMVDQQNGWAVADLTAEVRVLMRTTDGGDHWRNVTPVDGKAIRVSRMTAYSSHVAWAVASSSGFGTAEVFYTIDGGRIWRSANISNTDGVVSIQFIDARNGWLLAITGSYAGGNAAVVYHSSDGGQTWLKLGSELIGTYKRTVSFLDATAGWVAGVELGSGVALWVTRDRGRTWQPQKLPPPPETSIWSSSTLSPEFFTPWDGIVPVIYVRRDSSYAAIGTIVVCYATNDRGVTWKLTTPVPITGGEPPVYFADPKHGWVADGIWLHVTSDGGRRWTMLDPGSRSGSFFDAMRQLDFVSTQVGWGIRETSSLLLKTLDGGRTWNPMSYTIVR